jgi:hypothetical protein
MCRSRFEEEVEVSSFVVMRVGYILHMWVAHKAGQAPCGEPRLLASRCSLALHQRRELPFQFTVFQRCVALAAVLNREFRSANQLPQVANCLLGS